MDAIAALMTVEVPKPGLCIQTSFVDTMAIGVPKAPKAQKCF